MDVTTVTFESIFMELYVNHNNKRIIEAINRPPNTDLSPLNLAFEQNYYLILLVDYKINLLNHETNSETVNFLSNLFANTLLTVVSKPTRHGEQSSTLIENIITNIKNPKISWYFPGWYTRPIANLFFTGNSQNARSSTKIQKIIRVINDPDIEIFNSKIEATDWLVGEESDINTSHDLFNNSLVKIY